MLTQRIYVDDCHSRRHCRGDFVLGLDVPRAYPDYRVYYRFQIPSFDARICELRRMNRPSRLIL